MGTAEAEWDRSQMRADSPARDDEEQGWRPPAGAEDDDEHEVIDTPGQVVRRRYTLKRRPKTSSRDNIGTTGNGGGCCDRGIQGEVDAAANRSSSILISLMHAAKNTGISRRHVRV